MPPLLDLSPWLFLLLVSACVSTNTVSGGTGDNALTRFLVHDGRRVLTFVGYSGAGYEDEASMLKTAENVLAQSDPVEFIINAGVTPDGIGAVYKLASERGFTTMGIASTKASDYPASPWVQHIFYVEDKSWGGLNEETGLLSPTSERMVEHSDIMVAIGGGAIARDELEAARVAGKKVHFFPADLDHAVAIKKAREKGAAPPTDFSGEASKIF